MIRRYLITVILIVVSLAVFAPAISYDFVGWDDDIHVYANSLLNPPSLAHILQFWRQPHEGMYIPLTFNLWAVITRLNNLSGDGRGETNFNPHLYHLVNIVIHILNVLLVFAILNRVLRKAARPKTDMPGPAEGAVKWAAGAGALLYAVHPLQVEPVVWVSSLKDILSVFFSLLALWQYVAYLQAVVVNVRMPIVDRAKRKRYALFATLAFIPALLSKPAAVPVPLLALLITWFGFENADFKCGKNIRSFLRMPYGLLLIWLLIAIPFMFMAKFAEKDIPLGFVAHFPARLLLAGDAVSFYLFKLFVPVALGIDYGRTPVLVLEKGWLYYTWLFPVALAVLLSRPKDRRQWLCAFAIFIAGAMPTLGIVPHGYQVFSTTADRFLYLAMLGPALGVGWLLLSRPAKVIRYGAVVVVLLLVFLSMTQRSYWATNQSLFDHALRVNELSYMSHYNLGLTLADENDPARALFHYERALEIKPDYGRAHNNLGALLTGRGKYAEAIEHYAAAFRINPNDGKAYFNLYSAHNDLGLRLAERGDPEGAIAHYRQALRINPGHAETHSNFGNLLAGRGELEKAASHYREALRIKPRYAMAHNNLGTVLIRQGKAEEAIVHFEEALRIKPGFSLARYNLKRALQEAGENKNLKSPQVFRFGQVGADDPAIILNDETRMTKPE